MKQYLITGGTGVVGSQLVNEIKKSDSHITILTRYDQISNNKKISYVNQAKSGWEHKVPQNIDAIISLAGATSNKRWTPEYRQMLMLSRIQSIQVLYELSKLRNKASKVLFSASATGYYPSDLFMSHTEVYKTLPFDFLLDIMYQWECFVQQFEQLGTRAVIGRLGIILSNEGGTLQTMKLPYEYYIGGKLGSGQQWYSQIHINDLIQATLFLINNESASGPFNLTAPIPERQNLLGYTLARAMHKLHEIWVPSLTMRFILGQMLTVVLDTQKILPDKIRALGFQFKYGNLKMALEDLISK